MTRGGIPRIRAQINGMPVNSVIHAEVTASASGRSGRFTLTFGVSDGVPEQNWPNRMMGVVEVAIFMRDKLSESEARIFDGLANHVTYDPIRKIAYMRGHDHSSVLAGSVIEESFVNNTASEIAGQIARRHGFGADITMTTALIGSYRGGIHSQILLNSYARFTNEWALLTYLAKSENFELFVEGKTLVFRPSLKFRYGNTPLRLQDLSSIRFTKRCPLSRKTSVVVKSWNSWLNHASSHEERQSSDSEDNGYMTGTDGDSGEFVLIRPNLSFVDAENLAQKYLAALNERKFTVDIVMPGEVSLRPGALITVTGGDTDFNREYMVSSLRRCFSPTRGFLQYLRGTAVSENASDALSLVI